MYFIRFLLKYAVLVGMYRFKFTWNVIFWRVEMFSSWINAFVIKFKIILNQPGGMDSRCALAASLLCSMIWQYWGSWGNFVKECFFSINIYLSKTVTAKTSWNFLWRPFRWCPPEIIIFLMWEKSQFFILRGPKWGLLLKDGLLPQFSLLGDLNTCVSMVIWGRSIWHYAFILGLIKIYMSSAFIWCVIYECATNRYAVMFVWKKSVL